MSKPYLNLLLSLCLLVLAGVPSRAQGPAYMDSIIAHAAYYNVKRSSAVMFVHVDKTVYVNNESIWFTAYLLGVAARDLSKHHVLSAALVGDHDKKIYAQSRFMMDMGLGYGNLAIPDTIPPGHYNFIAITDHLVNSKPEVCFIQPLTIRSANTPTFNVELLLDTLYKDPVNQRVMIKTTARSGPLEGALISYNLGKDAKSRITGKAKTNVIGSCVLLLPKDHVTAAQHDLDVQVRSGTEVKSMHLNIPVKKQQPDARFYPEGGHLIAGVMNRIGWEVRTPGGTAIKATGVLYANNEAIDTINTDSFGMGMFYLNPQPVTRYEVKLLPNSTGTYPLPAALNEGVVIRAYNAIIKDSLQMQVRGKMTGKLTLLVHNYKQIFSAASFEASPKGKNFKIDASGIPRGLNTVTVLDSLGRPCAERLFFAHYDQKPRIGISVDNSEPGNRQKVSVSLKLNGSGDKPVKGIVSVACVQDNRFEVKNDNNIEHYLYLQSELDDLPLKDDLMGNAELDRSYMEELLLVRGWSKYKWPELMNASTADTVKRQDSLMFSGNILHFNAPLKVPVNIVLMKDSAIVQTLGSDATGKFLLSHEEVLAPPDSKVRLIVSGKSVEYIIHVNDPYTPVYKNVIAGISPFTSEEPLVQSTQDLQLKGMEHATHLKEVVIKASSGGYYRGRNTCGDYVCRYHVLNCPNHPYEPDNKPPAVGDMVYVQSEGMVKYYGCGDFVDRPGMISFRGVYAAKEFYGADYTRMNPTEPDYISTLFWRHGVSLTSDNKLDLSFYTSDITGKFRIIVQGVTNEDVVYGESSFIVRKKTP